MRALPLCLESREQADDPPPVSANFPWFWDSGKPQLPTKIPALSPFSPFPRAHDDGRGTGKSCYPRKHKVMNEQKGKEVASDVASGAPRACLNP